MGFVMDLIGGVASGGLFGLIGSIVGVGAKWLQERQRQDWQRETWNHEARLIDLNMQSRAAETENELKIVLGQADADQRVASYGLVMHDAGRVHRWVNDVRSLFRLFLTVFLWVIAGAILWMLGYWVSVGLITVDTSLDLIEYSVKSAIFAASTATVWWFGDRAMAPPGAKGR